jgi:hypothetical protein
VNRLLRWLDRRMFEKLAAGDERRAALSRANSLLPYTMAGPNFWEEEVGRYLDRANDYRVKAKTLR